MTDDEIKAALSSLHVLACTAWAEARGDQGEGSSSVEERIAVMCVVRNRLRLPTRYGDSYRAVCLARKQFSCWNPGTDANHLATMRIAYLLATGQPSLDQLMDETRYLAQGIISGVILDRTAGATHYFSPDAMVPAGRVPASAKGQTWLPIGRQIFYRAA